MTFAYIQKGFYCMLCGQENHKYLLRKNEYFETQNVISENFCSKLIYLMRELLVLKAQFLDPLRYTLIRIKQCINNDFKHLGQSILDDHFQKPNDYNVEYQVIMDCIYKGKDCQYICSEFVLGSPSNLFLGKIEYYSEVQYLIENMNTFSDYQRNI